MGCRKLLLPALELAQPDIVDDQEHGPAPPLHALLVGAVGKTCVQVIDEVHATGVADGPLVFACLEGESLKDVALASAALAGEEQILVAVYEGEGEEFFDRAAIKLGLEIPIEGGH